MISKFFKNLLHFLTVVCSWWWQHCNQNHQFATLFTAALLILCYYSPWLIKNQESARDKINLPSPPGPRGLPLIGNLPFLHPDLHSHFAGLARTYSPILNLRLGCKMAVVVSSPSLAKQALKDHDITFANHDVPAVARTMAYVSCNIVSSPYGAQWRMLRRLCVGQMLNGASLDAVYHLRRREVQRMVEEIHGSVGSPLNLGDQLFLTVLNVITSMLWGGTTTMEAGEEEQSGLGAEFRQVVGEITELLGKPNLSDFFPGLAWFDLQGLQRQIKRLFLRFDRIFDSIIEQRLKMGKRGKIFFRFSCSIWRKKTPR